MEALTLNPCPKKRGTQNFYGHFYDLWEHCPWEALTLNPSPKKGAFHFGTIAEGSGQPRGFAPTG
jgi:hypothetical protein